MRPDRATITANMPETMMSINPEYLPRCQENFFGGIAKAMK
jgi:hypothetical protein